MLGEDKFNAEIAQARETYPDVPVHIIKAVIATESSFDPKAFNPETGSPTGPSRGLMQITMPTARGLGFTGSESNLFLPSINIFYGTKLLSENFAYTGAWDKAVSMYNGGYRPELGFGEPIRTPGVRCMGRIVPVGQFCNQKHVDRFLKHAQYFARKEGEPRVTPVVAMPVTQAGGAGFWGVLALIGMILARAFGRK